MYSNVNKDTLYSVELPLFWFYFVFEKIFKVWVCYATYDIDLLHRRSDKKLY